MLKPSVHWWEYEDRHCCQEIIEGVFLGPSTIARDSSILSSNRISDIIIARSEREKSFIKPREHPVPVTYHVIDIDDSPVASCMSSFTLFLDLMKFLKNKRVLVIGMTGMNRSAALLCVLVVAKFSLTLSAAIEYMISRRRCVSISQNVVRQIDEFATAKIATTGILATQSSAVNRKRSSELV